MKIRFPMMLSPPSTVAKDFQFPRWQIALALLLGAIDLCWIAATPFSLSFESWKQAILLLCCTAMLAFFAGRVRHNERLWALVAGTALLLITWPILRLLNHLTMSLAFPKADGSLSNWDQLVHFDWLGYLKWADASPQLLWLMSRCYTGLTSYSAIAFLILVLSPRPAIRVVEFTGLFLSTSTICIIVGACFPAEAAMIHYAPSPDLFANISNQSGTYHIEALTALRSDPNLTFDLNNLPGLVTFPSFHTAMGVLIIYCCRSNFIVFVPSLIVNCIMISATPIFGSHYGIDVLGGAFVATLAIIASRGWLRFPLLRRSARPRGPSSAGALVGSYTNLH
jgi:PAP2 superfamily